MRKIDEKALIQQEIEILKMNQSDARKMIQYNFIKTIDRLNPLSNLKADMNFIIDRFTDKLSNFKPIVIKARSLFDFKSFI